MMANTSLYEELRVSREASPAEIKAAHRRRVSSCHPDRHHGKAEGGRRNEEVEAEFRRVQHAYEVLRDPNRRRRYDETGDDGSSAAAAKASRETEVIGAAVEAFMQALINKGGKQFSDPLQGAIAGLASEIKELESGAAQGKTAMSMLKLQRSRLKGKGGKESPGFLETALDGRIAAVEQELTTMAGRRAILQDARELLGKYECGDADVSPELLVDLIAGMAEAHSAGSGRGRGRNSARADTRAPGRAECYQCGMRYEFRRGTFVGVHCPRCGDSRALDLDTHETIDFRNPRARQAAGKRPFDEPFMPGGIFG